MLVAVGALFKLCLNIVNCFRLWQEKEAKVRK